MNTNTSLKIRALFLSLLLYFSFQEISAQKFTIPVLPDTQESVAFKNEYFLAQMNWLVANRDSLNAPIVLHVGDLVNFDNHNHWIVASNGMKQLDDANIPYVIALGNHDTEAVGENSGSAAPGNTNLNLRKTTKFNQYFPVERFTLQKGRYEAGKSDNSYYTFEAGGVKWLVVSLEFCARQGAAEWMSGVLDQFPEHNAIVLTHYHLTPTGIVYDGNAGYGNMNVKTIFENYIKPHRNVLMVLSGHVCSSSSRTDLGTQGNKIYQFLQDYQCSDYGGAYIRLLDIDVEKKTINAKMYSPLYDKVLGGNTSYTLSYVKFITESNTDVGDDVKTEIKLYPNPATRIVHIKNTINENPEVKLYNMQGVLMTETNSKSIDISCFSAGIYFLTVDGKQMKLVKI